MDHMKKRQMTSDLLLDIAVTLMECGAHTSRVIHNISRIAKAFNYDLELAILQKSIMTTITYHHTEAVTHTAVRRTKPSHLNLRILSDLTALSWQVAAHKPTLDELRSNYEAILRKPSLPKLLIPGVPLINSVLDIVEGYVLSGLSRLVNALNLIFCIALGLMVTLFILHPDSLW